MNNLITALSLLSPLQHFTTIPLTPLSFQSVGIDSWYFIAVTFDRGNYEYWIYNFGLVLNYQLTVDNRRPVNSHSSATIGYINSDLGLPTFAGYIDDVSAL